MVSNSSNTPHDPQTLPDLARILDELRRGKHLSEGDGPHVQSLRDNTDAYTSLFKTLGFSLVHHPRGFFYFAADPGSTVTELSGRMAVFVFILVEHIADRGENVEDTIMMHTFNTGELPHLSTDRYMVYMRDVGVTSPEDLTQVLKNMRRLGLVDLVGDDLFRFRTPAYRFLDLCSALAAEQEMSQSEDADHENEAITRTPEASE